MTRQLGDRRARLRLEVVGSLWGSLDVEEVARIINISDTGMLIASPTSPPVDSLQTVRLRLDGRDVSVSARVRHSRPALGPTGVPEYLVGLELMNNGDAAALLALT